MCQQYAIASSSGVFGLTLKIAHNCSTVEGHGPIQLLYTDYIVALNALYLQGNHACPPASCSLGSIHKAQTCKTHRSHMWISHQINSTSFERVLASIFQRTITRHLYLFLAAFFFSRILIWLKNICFQMLLIISFITQTDRVIQKLRPKLNGGDASSIMLPSQK